jgi:hypothetical protein
MGWSGRAPAPPAREAGKGRQRRGALRRNSHGGQREGGRSASHPLMLCDYAAAQHRVRIFFCVSPPLQLIISCAGIVCATFADTTSDRSALRTYGLALSGLPNEGRSIRAAFFVPQIAVW